ncbi:putative signal peptide peptidase SppA [Planctomycetes bacterium CA13]|uniref:Putative signal peptide peptidase SppA n=1 Tax=Novipirellula herctigrandis TaxID=2527986 RepID=A0A5C5Z9Z2_9BACT|nr:putative signal peptide peptidase SppA [Planctomycetes bacterium CA13]
MFRLILLCIAFFASVGCQHRPMRVNMLGNIGGKMNMDGNMNVTGDTRVDGTMHMTGDLATSIKTDNTASRLSQVTVEGDLSQPRRVAVVDVDGLLINQNSGGLGSMGENPVALFQEKLRALESDPSIASIVLRIDSPGGGVTATDIMCQELRRFKTSRNIPIVACIMSTGTGGAYQLAIQADHVIAHPTSIVGGIGVILNLYSMEDTLGQYNIAAIPVKSGDKIDGGSPVRTMEQDERDLLQNIADEFHQRFVNEVKSRRFELTGPDEAGKLDDWFDGRVVTGRAATEASMVDQTGYLDDAIASAKHLAALDANAAVVMLRRDNDRAFTTMDVTPNTSQIGSLIPLNIPGFDRSKLPTFMYLWQLEPSMVTR